MQRLRQFQPTALSLQHPQNGDQSPVFFRVPLKLQGAKDHAPCYRNETHQSCVNRCALGETQVSQQKKKAGKPRTQEKKTAPTAVSAALQGTSLAPSSTGRPPGQMSDQGLLQSQNTEQLQSGV